jgi:flagellar motor switch protein FliN/FliY
MSSPEQYETEDSAKRDFWKSILRIQADVAVVLAQQPVAVDRVLHFVPGIMIQFEKQCDSPLALEVKGQKIAEGEVVKVGDKFGLRISDVCEHSETWVPLVTQNSVSSPPAAG